MDFVDLFCGGGMVSHALVSLGLRQRVAVDINEAALESYAYNVDEGKILQADLSDEIEATLRRSGVRSGFRGVVWMSPPCQGFSHSGDSDLTRCALLPYCLAAIAAYAPRCWIVCENVAGFLFKKYLAEREFVYKSLYKSRRLLMDDEDLKDMVLEAADVGVPQSRRRLLMVVPPRGKKLIQMSRPPGGTKLSIKGAIGRGFEDPDPVCFPLLKKEREIYAGIPGGGNWASSKASRAYARAKYGRRRPPDHFLRRSAWSDLPACVLASKRRRIKQGDFLHPKKLRRFTIGEYREFQAIPREFWFSGTVSQRMEQVGNAVPPPMASYVVQNVLKNS